MKLRLTFFRLPSSQSANKKNTPVCTCAVSLESRARALVARLPASLKMAAKGAKIDLHSRAELVAALQTQGHENPAEAAEVVLNSKDPARAYASALDSGECRYSDWLRSVVLLQMKTDSSFDVPLSELRAAMGRVGMSKTGHCGSAKSNCPCATTRLMGR